MSPAPPIANLQQSYSRSERMVGRRILDDYILVPIVDRAADVDSIYDLNPAAAFIWEQFDGTRDGHAIVASLTGEFAVEPARAASDYLEFVSVVLEIGAVRAASTDAAGQAPGRNP